MRRPTPVIWLLLLLIGLNAISISRIHGAEITKDALQNLSITYNVWTKGKFSENGETPTYSREPLPIALAAAHMAMFTSVPADANMVEVAKDPHYVKQIVTINIVFSMLLLSAIWLLARQLSMSFRLTALTMILSWYFFAGAPRHIDRMYTELFSSSLLILAAIATIYTYQSRKLTAAVTTGGLLAAFALTKASGLYVVLVALPMLAAGMYFFKLVSARKAFGIWLTMLLTFLFLVTPWMMRNYLIFGDYTIAERGGNVLLTRAVKNRMTDEEYRAAFYVYAPGSMKHRFFESILGFEQSNLAPGGKYVRLIRHQPGEQDAIKAGNPDATISYYGLRSAIENRMLRELQNAGQDTRQVDQMQKALAFELIKADPVAHAKTTLPFAWRGIWSFAGKGGIVKELFNLLSFLSLLVIPFVAVWKRKPEWFAGSLVAMGYFLFHAFTTHFIPRYSAPLIPLSLLFLFVLCSKLPRTKRKPAQ